VCIPFGLDSVDAEEYCRTIAQDLRAVCSSEERHCALNKSDDACRLEVITMIAGQIKITSQVQIGTWGVGPSSSRKLSLARDRHEEAQGELIGRHKLRAHGPDTFD